MTAESHPSALALARALLDEEAGRAALDHAATCPACRERLDEAGRDRDRVRSSIFPRTRDTVERRVGRRRRTTTWWWSSAAVALAGAAAVLLVLLPATRPGQPAVRDEPAVTVKGTAVRVFARRGDDVFTVHDGDHLRGGDRLRFAVNPGGARFVLIGSIDGRGVTSIYYPSTAVPAGETVLPDSIILDDAPGPERLFAVFSDAPIDAASIAEALARIGAGGPAAIRATPLLPGALPTQVSLCFEKELTP